MDYQMTYACTYIDENVRNMVSVNNLWLTLYSVNESST